MKQIHMAGPWITDHEIQMVVDAMKHGWYERPYEYVEKFEKEFALYHDRSFALMTPNCTSALHLTLMALGIGKGDEVIVPECTWIASAAPISYVGATPVFCDIDPIDWCLSPASLRQRITSRTRAIIMVDLFGNMPQIDEIQSLAEEFGIHLIEDAAEALGSSYRGKKAGKFGVASVFSFHRTKTLVTGEGGILLLDDENLFQRCQTLRDHGRRKGGEMYFNDEVAYKYMPFNLQAALGYAQFQRLDELVGKKRWIFSRYRELLGDLEDLQLNAEPDHVCNGVWITAVVFAKRTGMTKRRAIEELARFNVPARPFFYPLSQLPAYSAFTEDYRKLNPVSYDISDRGINLPCALNLTEEQLVHISRGVRKLVCS